MLHAPEAVSARERRGAPGSPEPIRLMLNVAQATVFLLLAVG